ncbi:DUF1697 domain-containing protein [Paenibacillus allorhizosphaerae]|uniref:DUF1697 domain-containing protein n=1 Tax=Paenibacillus allorhizosphaerae TaxID=2849866 RepID=A0ABN7TWE2_9BACL|nr:DUF1697 domain-containing protein [Paenibacillus allorhizosphaerae]CAG7654765.1 hypothetical protein PAECIP111802_05865 [Paenibacillus allorhizosphaerae]
MTIHIALLRGINVGGNNKIKMAELREVLGRMGLARVRTYIQSGNILFESDEREETLRGRIELEMEKAFGLTLKVIIRTAEELRQMVAKLPFTNQQIAAAKASAIGECLHVSMLMSEPVAERVDKLKSLDFQNDQYRIIGRDVYLLFGSSIRDSKLAVQVEKLGVATTTRNWKTINKLVELADELENKNG